MCSNRLEQQGPSCTMCMKQLLSILPVALRLVDRAVSLHFVLMYSSKWNPSFSLPVYCALFTWFTQKSIVQKNQLSEPVPVPISLGNRRSTVFCFIYCGSDMAFVQYVCPLFNKAVLVKLYKVILLPRYINNILQYFDASKNLRFNFLVPKLFERATHFH